MRKESMYFIYEIKFPNGEFYVGKTKNLAQREMSHRTSPSGAILEFCKTNNEWTFEFNAIFKSTDRRLIDEMEARLISSLNCINLSIPKKVDIVYKPKKTMLISGKTLDLFNFIKDNQRKKLVSRDIAKTLFLNQNTLKASLRRLKKYNLVKVVESTRGPNGYSTYSILSSGEII